YHILMNPTGKVMKWRAVDWCVELNNLFTKVKNGGKGLNHTVQQILLESPLVQVYCNIQGMVQQTFEHTHLTTNHSDLDMTKTFSKILEWFVLDSPHVVRIGRKTRHEIADMNDKGHQMMGKAAHGGGEGGNKNEGDDQVEMEDIIMELM
ncbi:hypothetical protein PAXRUDRAFT_159334, partial [Paxillus rubicundulus Ve08.2h10]